MTHNSYHKLVKVNFKYSGHCNQKTLITKLKAMGANKSLLSNEEIEDFTQLTFFGKEEVLHCLKRFLRLSESSSCQTPLDIRIPIDSILNLPEFLYNPFGDRICRVFSSTDGFMSFEDFLDMASVLSDYAPVTLKADWAFRIFDFDEDGALGFSDIHEVVKRLTNSRGPLKTIDAFQDQQQMQENDQEELSEGDMERIVIHILGEADLNKSDTITPQEFRYIMAKSPDFAHNFRIRI